MKTAKKPAIEMLRRAAANAYEATILGAKCRLTAKGGEEAKSSHADTLRSIDVSWCNDDAEAMEHVREQCELLGYDLKAL